MRFGWFAYLVPFLFVVVPELRMEGDALSIVIVTIKSIFGIWFISVALMGYVIRHIDLPLRMLFAIAGSGMFIPQNILDVGIPLGLIGFILGAGLTGSEWIRGRRTALSEETDLN